jgi:hypothetical protein
LRLERKTTQKNADVCRLENHSEKSMFFSVTFWHTTTYGVDGQKNDEKPKKPAPTTSLDANPFHYESCTEITLLRSAFSGTIHVRGGKAPSNSLAPTGRLA